MQEIDNIRFELEFSRRLTNKLKQDFDDYDINIIFSCITSSKYEATKDLNEGVCTK